MQRDVSDKNIRDPIVDKLSARTRSHLGAARFKWSRDCDYYHGHGTFVNRRAVHLTVHRQFEYVRRYVALVDELCIILSDVSVQVQVNGCPKIASRHAFDRQHRPSYSCLFYSNIYHKMIIIHTNIKINPKREER
ncbi:uncharacterized protein LOC117237198 [Bombus vosnesenskii]|uniref:Uncharacterized protein LOC117237198 n=2 Tax=Pyrobombus TaxID=144703 RepID=A0A6J3KYE8_9HYME|nr:uncharacterized protein LOC117161929 [Bombus vancouverensis nearcticus]XP_033299721.1 uncharacterized protein LOC117205444 [Bombus bifarius]XP_033356834.1 uncharacterized protein LOC117237198 [Bombus vosnesenskii]